MNKVVLVFLDRLAERFTALLAGLVSSRVEGLHAAAQAEQQSQLEDLARGYEADGKPAIANTLRERASRLTSPDLAGEAIEIMHRVTTEVRRLPCPMETNNAGTGADLRNLPSFDSATKPSRKRRVPENTDPGNPATEHSS
jgi:hypothetical protein